MEALTQENLPKRTKIYATLGPVSSNKETIQKLYDAGVNAFRLNLSHGSNEDKSKLIDLIRQMGINTPIMLDTKGPEIRVGQINTAVEVHPGMEFIITTEQGVYEETGKISVSYENFTKDVDVGDVIVIDSGKIQAKAIEKKDKEIKFRVLFGDEKITTKRHINLYGKKVSLPSITDEDWVDIDFCIEKKIDFIALSFARNGDEIIELKNYLKKKGASNIQIVAKIESFESTQNLERIIQLSDGLIYARGDLSCEISYGEVPCLQKKVASLCNYYAKPLILATQLLISMIHGIRPTRAEVNDVANAVFDGFDSLMTSDETAIGDHPVLTIQTMAKIIKETERNIYEVKDNIKNDNCFGILNKGRLGRFGFRSTNDIRIPLLSEGANINKNLNENILIRENIISLLPFATDDVKAIVCIQDKNDEFARNITATRLNIPMYGFTNNFMLWNQMNHIWCIEPVYEEKISNDFGNNCKLIDEFMKKKGIHKFIVVGSINDFPTIQIRNI